MVKKSRRGYEIMKEIMAEKSSISNEGVPSFEYDPKEAISLQKKLFSVSDTLDELRKDQQELLRKKDSLEFQTSSIDEKIGNG